MHPAFRRFVIASALLVSASPALAQGPLSTGTFVAGRDVNWDVSVGTNPFVDAFQVTSPPGAWANGAQWISFNAGASQGGAGSYSFRTMFDLTGYDASTASLSFNCSVDNTFVGAFLNGNALGGVSCATFAIGATQNVSSGFNGSVNTLEFRLTGDQTTDGFRYSTVSFSARQLPNTQVPEPSTWVLMAAGLAGMGVMARRRRA